MRKFVLLLLAALLISPSISFAGPKLKEQVKKAHQAHAHKKKMKHAAHKDHKAQKEHHHHLLHPHKSGG